MPTLEVLLSPLPEAEITSGNKDIQVTQLSYDSREVVIGSALICVPLDEDLYEEFNDEKRGRMVTIALDAIKRGAVAIVAEGKDILSSLPDSVTRVFVPDARKALALMAAEFYDHPSRKIVLVGVTGTNGKTTTANLTANIFRHAGFKSVGVIGTLGATTENTSVDLGTSTTPRSLDIQRLLSRFLDAGVEAVAMEVSSHGLALQRAVGCAFDAAIFTNLTQDHLDFHKSMEEYWAAKTLFFTDIAKYSMQFKRFAAVINTDDKHGRKLIDGVIKEAAYECTTYSIAENSDIKAEKIEISHRNLGFSVKKYGEHGSIPFNVPLVGRFNIYNCLASISVGRHLKIPPETLQEGLSSAKAPTGRMEFIDEGQQFTVIVDFAHTPDALEQILTALKESVTGRLICVFGCGGCRDRSKRVNMGSVVARLADLAIITSDNPRMEDPQRIAEDILVGVKNKGKESMTKVEIDRRKAIKYALEIAKEGDTVVFAGKGHEKYQIMNGQKTIFDERGIVRETLRNKLKVIGQPLLT
ncbi:uncharacterized protein DFL_002206 [Arthrobotrys flagrans]|uniref:UDP-N-acetylmuramoyl-L-alanyl-D-glutamate--2,6-diaminopimelate ligase n=1 Tax=Arthrobotrys flagrans TaxID=97331 RepID=A0A437AA09_ARTFL|nr:hypothetical protein DFL_002206 [Arthrobotrys flagrans]